MKLKACSKDHTCYTSDQQMHLLRLSIRTDDSLWEYTCIGSIMNVIQHNATIRQNETKRDILYITEGEFNCKLT